MLYVKRARVSWTKYLSISFFLQSIFVTLLKSITFPGYILSTRLIIISFCYAFSGSVSSLAKSSPRANSFARYSQRGDVGYKRGRARFHILVRTKWLITFKRSSHSAACQHLPLPMLVILSRTSSTMLYRERSGLNIHSIRTATWHCTFRQETRGTGEQLPNRYVWFWPT